MWQLQKVDMPSKMGWMKGCILLTQRHLRHLTYTLYYDKCNTPGPHVLNLWDLGEAYLRRLFRGQLYCLFALAAILAAFDCSSDFLELVNCFVRQKTSFFHHFKDEPLNSTRLEQRSSCFTGIARRRRIIFTEPLEFMAVWAIQTNALPLLARFHHVSNNFELLIFYHVVYRCLWPGSDFQFCLGAQGALQDVARPKRQFFFTKSDVSISTFESGLF